MGFTEFGSGKHEVTQIRSTLHFASKYRAGIIVLAVAHANRGFTASPLSTAAFPLTHLRQRKGKMRPADAPELGRYFDRSSMQNRQLGRGT
jgi:hypothetical protein